MTTKRIPIREEFYQKMLQKAKLKSAPVTTKKAALVAQIIEKTCLEYEELLKRECVEFDDETKNKIETLLKFGVNKDAQEVIREAVKMYVDSKKEDIKKLIEEL